MLVRELGPGDLNTAFFECLRALWAEVVTPEAAHDVLARREACGVRTYVAVADGQIVGTASLLLDPKFAHGGRSVGHIEDVCVRADDQKLGVGSLLMKHLLKVCELAGCYKVTLYCNSEVVTFYEKFGFREYGHQMAIYY